MKKGLSLLLTLVIVMSILVIPAAARGNSKQDKMKTNVTTQDSVGRDSNAKKNESSKNDNAKKQKNSKQFRVELNEQRKELQKQKSSLNQQKETLNAQYESLLATGDTAGAESIMEQITALNDQMQDLQLQSKKIINERHMVVKTMYTNDELAKFDSASDLIAQMYADTDVLDTGCITVNNNLIKFDTPAYIKGGVILVPLRAIAEEFNREVSWNEETHTVIINKDDTVIELTPNGTTALVNGNPVEISLPADVTCGRTYVPLRFLADVLNVNVTLDEENEIIDIDDATDTIDESTLDNTTNNTITDTTTSAES